MDQGVGLLISTGAVAGHDNMQILLRKWEEEKLEKQGTNYRDKMRERKAKYNVEL